MNISFSEKYTYGTVNYKHGNKLDVDSTFLSGIL